MERHHDKTKVTVFTRAGQHLILTPGGEVLPHIMSTVVHDPSDNFQYVICEMPCNIADSEEDARAIYK